MELLGFYDEPYGIRVDRPARRTVPDLALTHRHPRPDSSRVSQAPKDPLAPAGPDSTRPGGPLIAQLWDTTALDESLLDWFKPGIIARSKLGGRRLSVTTILGVLAVAALMSAALWWLIEQPRHVETRLRATVTADAAVLRSTIEPLATLALSLDAGNSPDLSSSTATVFTAEAAARRLFADAADVVDSADVSRQAAVEAAGSVLDASTRLSRLIAYRLVAERVLLPPELPIEATPADIGVATEAVAVWRSEVSATLADLPADVLADHATRLAAWDGELQAWQEGYLDAVLLEQPAAVAAAVAAQTDRISGLRMDLLDRLNTAGEALATDLEGAGSHLDSLLGA